LLIPPPSRKLSFDLSEAEEDDEDETDGEEAETGKEDERERARNRRKREKEGEKEDEGGEKRKKDRRRGNNLRNSGPNKQLETWSLVANANPSAAGGKQREKQAGKVGESSGKM